MGQPVQASAGQDHMAHVQAHLAMLRIPGMAQSPAVAVVLQHLAQHAAVAARDMVGMMLQQMGQMMPPPGQPLPPPVEAVVAKAGAQLSEGLWQQVAQILGPQAANDPYAAIEREKLEVKRAEIAQRGTTDAERLELERHKLEARAQADSAGMGEEARQAEMEHERKQAEIVARERMNAADNATALIIAGVRGQSQQAARPRMDFNPNPGYVPAPRRG